MAYAVEGTERSSGDLRLSRKTWWRRARGKARLVEKGTSVSQLQSLRKSVGAEEVLTTSQVGASPATTSGSGEDRQWDDGRSRRGGGAAQASLAFHRVTWPQGLFMPSTRS